MAGSSRPLRADAERNRGQLIDAARAAFGMHGVTASLDEVARAAGVGAGTLYRHFPSRDHLVAAVIDDGLLELRDHAVRLMDDAKPVDALRLWLDAYIEQGSVFKGLAATLVNPVDQSDEHSTCTQARDAGAALVQRAGAAGWLRASTRPEDVLDLAAAIAWVGEQPARDRSQRDRLLDLLIEGLRSPMQV